MEYLAPYKEVKDYKLQIKIKNGPLLELIRQKGFKSVNAFARAIGVFPAAIGKYVNLQLPPMSIKRGWHKTVIKMSKVLDTPPELLFPEQHITKALAKNSFEANVSLEDIQQLTGKLLTDGPEVLMLKEERILKVKECMECLSPREKSIIEDRFYDTKPQTLEELGKKYNVSRERIRQIEQKAIRKMKRTFRKIYPEDKD